MTQKLILFGALLIMALLAGTASAVENASDTDGSGSLVQDTSLKISFNYNETGPFKVGDVVAITTTFNIPISFAELTVEDGYSSSIEMVNVSDSSCSKGVVWSCEYEVPEYADGAVDVTVSAIRPNGKSVEETDMNAFVIDNTIPEVTIIEPELEVVNTSCVLFNFSAYDDTDNEIGYALYIDGASKDAGVIASGAYKQIELNPGDGYYTWEIQVSDDAGNIGSSGVSDLYVDTCAPEVTLISPEGGYVDTEGLLTFNFTAKDALTAKYEDLGLYYQLYIDGEPLDEFGYDEDTTDGIDIGDITDGIDIGDITDDTDIGDITDGIGSGSGSGSMSSGEYATVYNYDLSDGAHNWSVSIEDEAGNCVISETRDFYVDLYGLDVSLVSPDNEYAGSPVFNFSVSGGAGLPFDCKLLINGEEVESNIVKCDEETSNSFVVGEDSINYYSVSTAVADGENMNWTVSITDCAGNNYEPEPYYFSLDTVDPASVANLNVIDAVGETQWSYAYDYPALYVSWDENTDEDLASTPYGVFISDFAPSCIEDMEEVELTSQDMDLYIEEYGGESIVYGKDYWVAVIARDVAGNYNDCFSVCGPVQTYEDMNITLDAGWNLKSVPKRLVSSTTCVESASSDSSDAVPETVTCSKCTSVFGEDSTVLYWDGSCWVFPETIEPCKGYWVYSPEAFENNIKFKPMSFDSTTPDVPPSLCLAAGWQMIGHTATQPAAWSTTLASLKGVLTDYKFSNLITYSCNEGWGGIIPETGLIDLLTEDETLSSGGSFINGTSSYPVGTLQYEGYMVPGQGYWVFMKEGGTYASIESVYNYQDIYGSDGTDDDGIDDGSTDGGSIDDIIDDIVDDGTVDDISVDNGTTDETADNGTVDNETTDNGTVDDEIADNGTVDDEIADNGTVDDEIADNETTDGGNISV